MVKRSLKRGSWYLPWFKAQSGKDYSENETKKKWPFLERGSRTIREVNRVFKEEAMLPVIKEDE